MASLRNEAKPLLIEAALVPDNKMRHRSKSLVTGTMTTRTGEEMTFELTLDTFVIIVGVRKGRWALDLDGILRMAAESLPPA